MKIRKITALLIITVIAASLLGCRQKKSEKKAQPLTGQELTIYNMFDNEDIFTPMIQAFKTEFGNVKINYRKFTDIDEYRDLIINELAEGEGPDIFFMHNSWFYQDYKKLTPAPSSISTQDFLDTYVDVTAQDLIIPDIDGIDRIYSFPLYVDNLALYYNRKYYNDQIPERGKPPRTWSLLEDDLVKLKKEDNSFERFKIAAIAMGRADNIIRGVDILLTLMLQHGTAFYDEDYEKAIFEDTQGFNTFGKPNTPGNDALNLYSGFALPNSRNYTWNASLSDPNSAEKEILTFVKGKVAMIIGYSYLYEEIVRQINVMAKKNPNTIEVQNVGVVQIPQVFDPEEGIGNMATLASYFTPVVSRTSQNPGAAWAFISFITNQENARFYNEKTHRPTARRDLIEEQSQDPIYGVFVKQLGFTRTFIMTNPKKYYEIFTDVIEQVLGTVPSKTALKVAEDRINSMIPSGGLYPGPPPETLEARKAREAREAKEAK